MIGGKNKFTNSVEFVVGQDYSSEEGEIPNISETGSLNAPEATFVKRNQTTNVTQIFQETFGVSYAKQSNMGTLAGANIANQTANPISEVDFQGANKMKKIARSIEKTFIQGTYNKAKNDGEVNQTRGIVQAITTNTIDAGGKPVDIWMLNDLMQKIYASQGDISNLVVWCDTVTLNQINGNAVENGLTMTPATRNENGIQIRKLILPSGELSIGLGQFLPAGTLLLLNFDVIGPVEQPTPAKGNFFVEALAKTGAGDKYQIFGQIGLDHGPEWYHGKITGLSTEFVAPKGRAVVIKEGTASV